jgi:hypothetical protein
VVPLCVGTDLTTFVLGTDIFKISPILKRLKKFVPVPVITLLPSVVFTVPRPFTSAATLKV